MCEHFFSCCELTYFDASSELVMPVPEWQQKYFPLFMFAGLSSLHSPSSHLVGRSVMSCFGARLPIYQSLLGNL